MMNTGLTDVAQLAETVEALCREVARLSQRTVALEKALPNKDRESVLSPDPTAKVEGVSEELLVVIAAAIAAYLGVKPHIRQIHLLGGEPWGVQGRVTIQASHTLLMQHD